MYGSRGRDQYFALFDSKCKYLECELMGIDATNVRPFVYVLAMVREVGRLTPKPHRPERRGRGPAEWPIVF